jgi:hypothetical protein
LSIETYCSKSSRILRLFPEKINNLLIVKKAILYLVYARHISHKLFLIFLTDPWGNILCPSYRWKQISRKLFNVTAIHWRIPKSYRNKPTLVTPLCWEHWTKCRLAQSDGYKTEADSQLWPPMLAIWAAHSTDIFKHGVLLTT